MLLKPETTVNHLLHVHFVNLVIVWTIHDGKTKRNIRLDLLHDSSKNPSTGLFQPFSFLNFHGCFSGCMPRGLGHSDLVRNVAGMSEVGRKFAAIGSHPMACCSACFAFNNRFFITMKHLYQMISTVNVVSTIYILLWYGRFTTFKPATKMERIRPIKTNKIRTFAPLIQKSRARTVPAFPKTSPSRRGATFQRGLTLVIL